MKARNEQEKHKITNHVRQHLKNKITRKVCETWCLVLLLRRSCCPSTSSSHFIMACHATSSLCYLFSLCSRLLGILRRSNWGSKEERGGVEGRFLKGSSQWVQKMSIITVSTDFEWGEKRAHFHLKFFALLRSTKLLLGGSSAAVLASHQT